MSAAALARQAVFGLRGGSRIATKDDLKEWLIEALRRGGGRATVVEACRDIWGHHEADLRSSGTLFFTWQYDVRWAAHALRRDGLVRPVDESPRGVWELI